MKKLFTDQEVVENLKESKLVNETVEFLYNSAYKSVRGMARKYGMSEADAEDLFQDTLLIFIEIVCKDRYDFTKSSVTTFIYAIAQRLRFRRQKRSERQATWEEEFFIDNEQASLIIDPLESSFLSVEHAFQRLGHKCQTILRAYYLRDEPLQKIAISLDSTILSVKQMKFRCLERLRKMVDPN